MSSLSAFESLTGGLPPREWDELAGNRLYSSYDWLRFCATDIGGRTTTGAVHADGAAVSVTAVAQEPNPFYQWNTQLTARGLPAPAAAGLLVGQRRGYQTHLLTPEGAGAQSVAPALLDGVRTLASELAGSELLDGVGGPSAPGPVPVVASFVGTSDVQALRSAGVRTSPVLLTTDAWVSIPEGGWAQWLQELPSKGRRDSVKQEVKAFAAAGYEISKAPLTECYRQAADLLAGTQKRYGHSYDLHVLSESFRLQGEAMGAKAQVLFCARPGSPQWVSASSISTGTLCSSVRSASTTNG